MMVQEAPALREFFNETNHSELAAFTSYALAFPSAFQALVDTYNVCIFTMSSSRPLCGSSAPGPLGLKTTLFCDVNTLFCFFTYIGTSDDFLLVAILQVMRSGVPNFCAVALALHELGYAFLVSD